MELRKQLIKLGVYPNLKGYHHIIRAVEIIKEAPIGMVRLYEVLAEESGSTAMQVERHMRYCIKKSRIRLTTSEFIFLLAENGIWEVLE